MNRIDVNNPLWCITICGCIPIIGLIQSILVISPSLIIIVVPSTIYNTLKLPFNVFFVYRCLIKTRLYGPNL